jgi:hypothetical protein
MEPEFTGGNGRRTEAGVWERGTRLDTDEVVIKIGAEFAGKFELRYQIM